MNLTQEQARRVAQVLYPQLWKTNRVEAVAKAIEFIADASEVGVSDGPKSGGSNSTKTSGIVRQLGEHMRVKKLNVNLVARAIGVSSYTVRTWLEGKYKPSEENCEKITNFLASFQPEEGAVPGA